MRRFKKVIAAMVSAMMVATSLVVPAAAYVQQDETITVFYTNDVHTYIDQDITYAKVATLHNNTANSLLIDAGDHIQGTAFGGEDEGATIIELMNAAGYDLATLGNHEFDYGMARAIEAMSEAEYPYISCNMQQDTDLDGNWDNFIDPCKMMTVAGKNIAFIGITTPETISKTAPVTYQNENGEWIYRILAVEEMYAKVQATIDAAKEAGADYVIALGHLGIDPSSEGNRSIDVIENTTGLDAFIDGHSHSTVECQEVTDKAGNTVILTQTGSYLATVGKLTIAADGTLTTQLLGADYFTENSIEEDATVKAINDGWVAEVNARLEEEIGETDIKFTIKFEDEKDLIGSKQVGDRAVRMTNTNLSDMDADGVYWYINKVAGIDCDVAVVNGGGIRATIEPGVWTKLSAKTVHPFGNVLCVMEVPGQMILDALEFGARLTPDGECGGFLAVAGLSYDVNTAVPSTVQLDDNGLWCGAPTGAYRVTNVKIYNRTTKQYEALDLTKKYTIGGNNFTLRNQGDGFNMFDETKGSVLVMEGICMDYLAMVEYIKNFTDTDGNGLANIATANSPLIRDGLVDPDTYKMNYENMGGTDRIDVKEIPDTPTGDNALPMVWIAFLAFSAIAAAGVVVSRKRNAR